MGTEQKRRMRRISSLLLAFVLCACFTTMVLIGQIGLGLCDSRNVIEAKNKSQYVGEAYKAFREKYEAVLLQNGLPAELTDKAFGENNFFTDSRSSTKNSFKNGDGKVHCTGEPAILAEEISTYLSKGNQILGDRELTAIKGVANQVASYYEKYTTFKFGQVFYQYKSELVGGLKLFLPCLMTIAVATIVCLWVFNRKRGRTIDYLLMSIVGSMLSSSIIYFLTDFRKSLLPQEGEGYYSEFLLELYKFTVPPLAFSLAMGAVISVILILVRKHGK